MNRTLIRAALLLLAAATILTLPTDDSFAQRKKSSQRGKRPSAKSATTARDSASITPSSTAAPPTIEKDTLHFADSLKAVRQRIERLQTVLDKVTFGPQSYYFSRMRSWTIPLSDAFNDSVSQYFFEVSDNDSSFTELRGDIQVIATSEPSTDLVAMYFAGNSKERKGQRLREALMKKPERNMYRQILESREYSEDKELIDRKFKIADLTLPRLVKNSDSVLVSFDRYSLSTDHTNATVITIRVPDNLRIRFGNMWGAEVKLGYDEFSFPFWTAGNIAFMAIYNHLKVGAHVPFKWGSGTEGLTSIIKPRQMVGTYGITTEFDWAFAGGSFMIGFPRRDPDGTFIRRDSIVYLKTAANAWYSLTVNLHQNTNLFRLKAGLGFEIIGADLLNPTGVFAAYPSQFFWTPYFAMDYLNQQFARRFGLSLQYFRDRGFGKIWLEIIPEQLRVEGKFMKQIIRSPESWEPPYFVILSIPYTFSL
jgi:hypothetical protein